MLAAENFFLPAQSGDEANGNLHVTLATDTALDQGNSLFSSGPETVVLHQYIRRDPLAQFPDGRIARRACSWVRLQGLELDQNVDDIRPMHNDVMLSQPCASSNGVNHVG